MAELVAGVRRRVSGSPSVRPAPQAPARLGSRSCWARSGSSSATSAPARCTRCTPSSPSTAAAVHPTHRRRLRHRLAGLLVDHADRLGEVRGLRAARRQRRRGRRDGAGRPGAPGPGSPGEAAGARPGPGGHRRGAVLRRQRHHAGDLGPVGGRGAEGRLSRPARDRGAAGGRRSWRCSSRCSAGARR